VIDPGADGPLIKNAIKEAGVEAKFIINTHGHADHIAANKDFKLPVMIHRDDAAFLKNPYKNMSAFFGFWVTSPYAERLFEDGDQLNIGQLNLKIIHTPGHTPGSICIKTDSVIFTGDTLFKGGVGRTDLTDSSEKDLLNSIKSKLLVLDNNITIYPGHGPSSTIGEEKMANPFIS
jgi:glyoxylase-like metal-dependent hydrolase (beta-lactamase superfamily II)